MAIMVLHDLSGFLYVALLLTAVEDFLTTDVWGCRKSTSGKAACTYTEDIEWVRKIIFFELQKQFGWAPHLHPCLAL